MNRSGLLVMSNEARPGKGARYQSPALQTRDGMHEDRVVALFKIGAKEHMHSLLYEGAVYMATLSYFESSEVDDARRDRYEGISFAKDMDGWSFSVEHESSWHHLGTMQGPIVGRDDTLGGLNIYCLHSRTNRDFGTAFELSNLGFGDSFVLFLDPNEFFRRLEEAALKVGQTLKMGFVEYIDPEGYTGHIGPFRKFAVHDNQREFRIVAYPGTGESLTLRLGDLSDIALMGPTNRRLRLDPKS